MSIEDLGGTDAATGEPATDMTLWDVRLTVDRIEGRSVCGMRPGDWCEVTDSSKLRLPDGGHFCIYALQAALPLIPAKQRDLPAGDWLERDSEIACPDPEERLIMRLERTRRVELRSDDLT
ncbi:TIGR04076 family protein [Microbacterium sp. NPDC076895]|uniref:TIGR04076 family protein n=1 Tax=Microbacterium sp. NPDC076895 TaxID=3154957 RepID=UPI00341D8744